MSGLNFALAGNIIAIAQQKDYRLFTVESCTGGMLSAALTAVDGASNAFVGGIVTYANQAKKYLCGVDSELFAQHGAVSAAVAIAMAKGGVIQLKAMHDCQDTMARLHCPLAVAITGIAGPQGGSQQKPVGTVFIAIYSEQSGKTPTTKCQKFTVSDKGRTFIRTQAANQALAMLHKLLSA